MKVANLVRAIRGTRKPATPAKTVLQLPQSRELPADLEAAIEGCYVFPRSSAEDGAPRSVVQLAGRNGGWVHSIETSRDAIAARWPGLSEQQLARALRFLDSVVANHLRAPRRKHKQASFVNSWRGDDLDE